MRRAGKLAALALSLGLVLSLAGCGGQKPAEQQFFAMDTAMSVTVYGPQAAADEAMAAVYALEQDTSSTRPGGPITGLNDRAGEWVELPEQVSGLLEDSLALCALTGGALDLTAYSAVQAWGFISGDYRIPPAEELAGLKASIDYTRVQLQDSRALLPEGMALDLGAVAKGYAGDLLSGLLREEGVDSALLDLGQSTIQAVGPKPDGSPWRIGIRDPEGEGSAYLGVLELTDLAMGTSGGYQRYFTGADGETYWHIIDPETAAPARSGLASVTIVSPSGLLCDGLSTALFVMGQEAGADFWRAHPELDFDVIFITDSGEISITPGLEETFSLASGYENREVTVLR